MKNRSKNKRSEEKRAPFNLTQYTWRSIWLGGAIGAYFGWFFRPVREPSVLVVLGLSVLIAIVFLVLSLFQKPRPSIPEMGRSFLGNLAKYAVILAALEGRHLAYDWGGRPAVLVLGIIVGISMGYWFGKSAKNKSLIKSKN